MTKVQLNATVAGETARLARMEAASLGTDLGQIVTGALRVWFKQPIAWRRTQISRKKSGRNHKL